MELQTIRFLCVMLCSVFVLENVSAAMTDAQVKQAMKTLRNMCLPKSGTTKEALEKMAAGEFDDDDKKTKCYLSCVFGMMQAIKKNKINLNMIKSQVTKMLEPELGKKIVATFESCKEVVGDDNCDLAYKFAKCVYETDKEV